MLLTNLTLPELLPHLAAKPVAAEIGVFKGDFSRKILDLCQPSLLHLIDPWAWQSGDYRFDMSNGQSQAEQDGRHEQVVGRFLQEISNGQVFIHRAYSKDAVGKFPDAYFDWVYIDGDHTREGCLSDLELYAPKIKPGGLMLGDDFVDLQGYRDMKVEVIDAVRDFVRQGAWEFSVLCSDWRFILTRNADLERRQSLYYQVVQASSWLTEIKNPEHLAGITSKGFDFGPGQKRFFFSFG
jgi:hypothetical protein